MPSKSLRVRHIFSGGWATDFGPSIPELSPDQSGLMQLPYLVEAENIIYDLDGGPRKIGGTSKVNASQVASGAVVRGAYDYWRQGTSGVPTRRRIIHAGTDIYSDNDDGVFMSIVSGVNNDSIPCYSTFDDLLIISSSEDAPRSWDQSTAQLLAGTPPNFAFSCVHKGRVFASGNPADPSKVYYSVFGNPEDWVGAGSGNFNVDQQDGDVVTGLASHKEQLWIFKGPNKGSIHRLDGSSSSDFVLNPHLQGLGAINHNGIFKYSNELGFVSQFGSVHSLESTDAYGGYLEAAISRPINNWIFQKVNYRRLNRCWAAVDPLRSLVMITIPIDSSTDNNIVIGFDYRFNPVRWFSLPAYEMGCLGQFVDQNGLKRILGGGNDGYLRRTNLSEKSLDGSTSIAAKVTVPYLGYGDPMTMKTLRNGSVGISPRGDYTLDVLWSRDNELQQSLQVSQGGTDVLGPAAENEFILGTSVLAGAQYVDIYHEFNEEGGEFRSVQYQFVQNGLGEDMEIHSFSASIEIGAESTEN